MYSSPSDNGVFENAPQIKPENLVVNANRICVFMSVAGNILKTELFKSNGFSIITMVSLAEYFQTQIEDDR